MKVVTNNKHRTRSVKPISVGEVQKEYGVKFSGDPNIPFSRYLKDTGNKKLGNVLEAMERIYKVS